MICINRSYKDYSRIFSEPDQDTTDNRLRLVESPEELIVQIQMELTFLGRDLRVDSDCYYPMFIRRTSKHLSSFLEKEMLIDVSREKRKDGRDKNIIVSAEFPSGLCCPFIEYNLRANNYFFPATGNDAYFFMVNAIRKGQIKTRKDIRIADILAYQMDYFGYYNGRRILDEKDVKFAQLLSIGLLNDVPEES